jgi:hypothetical protein
MGLLDKVTNTRTALVFGVVSVVAGVAIACGGGGSGGQPALERSPFSYCVDTYNLSLSPGADAETLARAEAVINSALDVVKNDPRHGTEPARTIHLGCPVPPAPSVSPPGAWRDGQALGSFPTVAPGQSKSPYFVHVFVKDLATMDSLLGSTEQRVQPQEALCEGDYCRDVTYAIYVTEEEIMNDPDLFGQLAEVTQGLRDPFWVVP